MPAVLSSPSLAGQLPQGPQSHRIIVGASLLAMVVNDDAGCLDACGALEVFASVLAPTGFAAFR
jgi:hypothetical protein